MKKLTLALTAVALVLGLSYCRKNIDTVATVADANGVYIELNVDNGSKVIVDPYGGDPNDPNYTQIDPDGCAPVTWESGDNILVGYNGKHVGYLSYDGSKFSGTITIDEIIEEGDYLHFYFMGNVPNPRVDSVATKTAVIKNQKNHFPVISYGRSTLPYKEGNTQYRTILFNYCSIRQFKVDVELEENELVLVKGMLNKVELDFGKNVGLDNEVVNPFTYSMDGEGDIILHSVTKNGVYEPYERWAIVLPTDGVTTAMMDINGYDTQNFDIEPIGINEYILSDAEEDILLMGTKGFPNYRFTINEDGDYVRFSRGNLFLRRLSYDESWRDAEWGFLSNQIDVVERNMTGAEPSTTIYDNFDEYLTMGLFKWGATGYFNDYSNTVLVTPESTDWHYVSVLSLTMAAKNEFGYVANIANNGAGLDGHNDWFTLSDSEWGYLLYQRKPEYDGLLKSGTILTNAAGLAIYGMVLYPDGYKGSAFDYTVDSWEDFENRGCVFFPAAGRIGRKTIDMPIDAPVYFYDYDYGGYYWARDSWNNENARVMMFDKDAFVNTNVHAYNTGWNSAAIRSSVRLVR